MAEIKNDNVRRLQKHLDDESLAAEFVAAVVENEPADLQDELARIIKERCRKHFEENKDD